MNASQKLSAALRKKNAPPEMIERAKKGYYGDFTSPLATPITQLILDATKAGLPSIALQARLGDFDGE
jgi:hypothetical protein